MPVSRLVASVGFLALASSSMGATIAAEDFGAYVPLEEDASLQGRLSMNGFNGNPIGSQVVPDSTVTGIYNWIGGTGHNRAILGDLSYPGYTSSGGQRLQCVSGGVAVRAVMDTSSPTVFTNYVDSGVFVPAIGKTGTTLYLSFLLRVTGTTTTNSQAFVSLTEQTAASTHTSRSELGQTWNNANIRSNGTVLESLNDTTHLVVLKLQFNGTTLDATDVLTTWYDPNLSLPEASQTVGATSTRNLTFTHLSFLAQGTTSNALTKLEADDIRFGTTWGDVTPVPEPTAATSLLGGSLLLARRRRG